MHPPTAFPRWGRDGPTPEHAAKAKVEVVDLGALDPTRRGHKVKRIAKHAGWRRGMTRRQLAAADELEARWIKAGFHAIPGQQWTPRVDSGPPSADAPHALARRRRALWALIAGLHKSVWAVIEACVLRGLTLKDAAALIENMPQHPKARRGATAILLSVGLDALALAFFGPER